MARHIFDQIIAAGDRGVTTDELNVIFEPLGQRNQVVSARVKDLVDRGMIRRGPDKRLTRSEAQAEVSRAVPEAAANFDLYWHRRIKKTPEQRALHEAIQGLPKLAKRIAKQAETNTAELPALAEAQGLFADALLRLYVVLNVR